ncbi:MAG: hypothetical protein KatS3mg082_0699 [Nitrospiraceae bacterium]|nr:MAG: hypothetical protein KatS3mg082_0699 [Nitrospiraceae bacterium]
MPRTDCKPLAVAVCRHFRTRSQPGPPSSRVLKHYSIWTPSKCRTRTDRTCDQKASQDVPKRPSHPSGGYPGRSERGGEAYSGYPLRSPLQRVQNVEPLSDVLTRQMGTRLADFFNILLERHDTYSSGIVYVQPFPIGFSIEKPDHLWPPFNPCRQGADP